MKDVKLINIPDKCPYCGEATKIVCNSISGVETLFCVNQNCWGILLKKFSTFVSKQAMNIDGLSDKTLEKFIKLGWIHKYSDIYTQIPKHSHELSQMEGFGERSVTALLESIEKSKNTTLTKLFIALNIDNIGKQNAAELEKFFNSDPNNVLKMNIEGPNSIRENLSKVNGFGDVMVDSICKWRNNASEMKEYTELIDILTFTKKDNNSTNKLVDMKFVITGSVKLYKNRDELVSVIESNGGKVQSGVNKDTTYLINNDVNSNSSKNKKAKELGISIISEEDFNKLLDNDTTTKPIKKGLF